jgi:hypothetical protein
VPSPSALVDVETRNFGNKHFELRVETLPGLFTEESFCEEHPIVTPIDFRALLGENEHCELQLGTASAPPDPLPAGVFKWCDNQVDVYTHKVCISSIDLLSLPKTIDNKETNRFKQFVDVRRTLELDTTTPTNPTSTLDVEFTKLGDGTALEIVKDVGTIFPQFKYERTRPVVTPADFRALLQEQQTDYTTDIGHAAPPAPLPAGYISVIDADETLFTHRFQIRQIDTLSLPKHILNAKTNRFKQVVTVDRKLDLDSVAPPVPTDLTDVEFTVLGDGTAVTVVESVSEVFDERLESTEVADLVPELFRAVLPTYIEEFVETGATVTPHPPLAPGDFFRSEKRETEFTRRITTRGRSGITYPQSKVASKEIGGERFGGEVMQTTAFLDITEPPVETGLGVVSSEVRDLGNGTWFRTTQKWDIAIAWPTLLDFKFDEESQANLNIERQTVDSSYTPAIPIAGTDYFVEDVEGIDKWHSKRTKTTKNVVAHHDKASALISYRSHPFQFPGTLDYNRLITFSHREGYRRANALVARHTIRTWWINSATPPVVGDADLGTVDVDVKEIITDTVNVPVFTSNSNIDAQTYPEVLHDDITNTLGAFYPATTPSLTKYYLGTPSGGTSLFYVAGVAAGGTGYGVGDTLTASGHNFTVISLGATNSVSAVAPVGSPGGTIIVGFTSLGTFAASGGGGTGCQLTVYQVTYDIPVAGSAWVGTEKPIAAEVKQTNIPNLWKVVTESVVMR